MTTQHDRDFRFKACQRCGGDAYVDAMDEPEWRCLQCARPVQGLAVQAVQAARAVLRAA